MNQGVKNRAPVFGTASLNLAEYGSVGEGTEHVCRIPVNVPGCSAESCPSLIVSAFLVQAMLFVSTNS